MPKVKRKPGESTSAWNVRAAQHERKRGQLHSGSKRGPTVTNPKQAIAIGLSEARRAGAKGTAPKKNASTKKR
jgi:hypothetical protein